MLALWAEMNVVVADEFRDGNVPAQQAPLPVTQRAYAALPETVEQRYFRGDSACDEEALLTWLRHEQRENGPQGFIGFAVSARMNPVLRGEILATPEERWQPYSEDSQVVKECAQVDYFPEETAGEPLPRAAALGGDSDPEEAGRVVWRRRRGEALRGADESVGLEAADGCWNGIARRRARLKRRTR